jgi:hypothetical protein
MLLSFKNVIILIMNAYFPEPSSVLAFFHFEQDIICIIQVIQVPLVLQGQYHHLYQASPENEFEKENVIPNQYLVLLQHFILPLLAEVFLNAYCKNPESVQIIDLLIIN